MNPHATPRAGLGARCTVLLVSVLTAAAGTLAAAPAGASPSSSADGTAAGQATSGTYSWHVTPTGTKARLRGLSAVSRTVAWASGTEGTVLRTVDGGGHWASVGPHGTGNLQFRDIEAFSADKAVALSIGEGSASRVYFTQNGGRSWTQTFRSAEPTAFYDCLAFSDATHGLAVSDPVDGKFRLARTSDGGRSWAVVDPAGMPPAQTGEFAFAASGTCLTAGPGGVYHLVSGGVDPGRVFTSTDGGSSWAVTDSPLAGGAAAGVFSVQFRDRAHGILVGGDYLHPTKRVAAAAWTKDGGLTWHRARRTVGGYRSGSDWVAGTTTAIAVGPTGSDVSTNSGQTWTAFDSGSLDSVSCAGDGGCWASGDVGVVATLSRG